MKYVWVETLPQRIQELASCERLELDCSAEYAVHPPTGRRLATIQVRTTLHKAS